MKKFVLDLSEYEIEVLVPDTDSEGHEMKEVMQVYPLRDNINVWLRSIGIFQNAEDIAEAVCLAKRIRDCKDDSIELDDREADVLKQAINRIVKLTHDGMVSPGLGGEVHEEAIIRIVKMKEVK